MNTVLKKLAALAVTSLTCLCASAYDFSTDGIYYKITNATAKEVEVTSGDNGYSGSVVVPSTVTYNNKTYTVTAIGSSAFYYCSGLTSVTLPNSLTTIKFYAFFHCEDLTSITLPNSLTTIGEQAFYSCTALTSITIPNSVTTIGKQPFLDCSSMTSIDVEADNQKYSSVDGILYDKAQTSLICCPGGKTGNIIFSNTVTTIGGYAFRNCSKLTSITLPNSLTTIMYYAFSDCSGLTSITLPNSLTAIGNGTFFHCTSLTSVTSLAIVPPASNTSTFSGVDVKNCTLYVPAESVNAYKEAVGWKEFGIIKEADSALGIGSIEADSMADEDVEVFNVNGAKVSDTLENLPAGIYIVRNGLTVRKVVIK